MRDFPCTVFPWTDYPYAGFPYTDFPCTDITHTEQPENKIFALWAPFAGVGIPRDMASRPKAAYSERKCPKPTLILTVNYPIYPCCKATSRLPHKLIRSTQWQTVYFFKSCCLSRLMDWYLFRLLLDYLVFLYLVFIYAGFSPCGFSMCGFATSGFSMCGYSPCGGTEKPLICALSGVFLCGNISEASHSKAAYSERKCLKSPLILTLNCPVYPPI